MAEGRRQRVKDRARSEGIESFEPHELLELMLYPFIPRKDTKPIAVELLKVFGSLDGVLNATERDLLAVSGMPRGAAFHFPLYYPAVSRAKNEGAGRSRVLSNYDDASRYICERIGHLLHEEFLVIRLDGKKRVIRAKTFSMNEPSRADISMRTIADHVLGAQSSCVIVGHNHASGEISPSFDDMQATQALRKLLESLGIAFLDHIIVYRNKSFSFNKSNLMKAITVPAAFRIAEDILECAEDNKDYE